MIRNILLLIITLINGYYALAQKRAYSSHEHLVYNVDYKIGFNVEVATVSMFTVSENYNGKKHFKITATAKVRPAFRWFYDLHHKYEVWIDSLTSRPSYFQNDLHEENYRFKSSYNYDWNNMKVTTWGRNFNQDSSVTNIMELSENSFDAISLFYQIRGINFNTLKYNTPYSLDVVFDDNIRRVYYRYMGKEKRNIKKLGNFNVIKIACTIATSDGKSYEDGNEFVIYLTDDENKIPVFMHSPIKVGSVNVNLSYADGLLYPPYSLKSR